MKCFAVSALLLLILLAGTGRSGPARPRRPEVVEVPGYLVRSVREEFAGGVRTSVIVSGNGRGYLGVYVYDALGNCVARDDFGNSVTYDDLNAEWYVPVTASYGIDIFNLGRLDCQAELAFP